MRSKIMDMEHTKKYITNLLMNAAIIFVSYLLAAFVRYRLIKLQADKSINPFSFPFLIIAMVYAVIVSFTFDYTDYPRYIKGDGIYNGISRIIFQNTIGCIAFLGVLFVTGITNFSRLAVFLLGVFSCFGLILRQILMYSAKARKRCRGEDIRKVLLIGSGKRAEDYIDSMMKNPQFGIRIVGYLGENNRLETDLEGWFNPEKYPFPVVRWLGGYSSEKVREIVKDQGVEEIVVTENIEDSDVLFGIGPEISILLPYSNSINRGSQLRDLGTAKIIKANEYIKKKSNAKVGMVISIALLLLILMMKRFNLNVLNSVGTMEGLEKSCTILFAFFAFSMYWAVSDKLGSAKHASLRSAAITAAGSTVLILLYEFLAGGPVWSNAAIDLIPVLIVIFVCLSAKEIMRKVSQSFIGA